MSSLAHRCLGPIALSLVTFSAAAQPQFTVTDLDGFGFRSAAAVNNRGEIAGTSADGHLLILDGGTVRDCGDVNGHPITVTQFNDEGTVIVTATINDRITPFEYAHGAFLELPWDANQEFAALSPTGNIAAGNSARIDGAVIDLGTVDGNKPQSFVINTANQIAGMVGVGPVNDYTGQAVRPFVWQSSKLQVLGTLPGGAQSFASAMNESGMIVGNSESSRGEHVFLYSAGNMVDTGVAGTRWPTRYPLPIAINDYGVVVATEERGLNGKTVPAIWRSGHRSELNTLVDWSGSHSTALATDVPATGAAPAIHINNHDQIVVRAIKSDGSIAPVLLTPKTAGVTPGRIVNASIRGATGSGPNTLIMGFVTYGANRKVLARAVAPSLEQFGVVGFAQDPALTVYRSDTIIGTNNDWGLAGNASEISAVAQASGAFPLNASSKDAAILTSSEGVVSVHISNASGQGGVALGEVYLGEDPDAGRLLNYSGRLRIADGTSIGILGFTVTGGVPVRVLVRAVGPGLRRFGLSDVLTDPMIRLNSPSGLIAANDDWGSGSSTPEFARATTVSGAFPLDDASKDSGMLLELEPDTYTLSVAGAHGDSGVALIELYVLP